MTERLKPDVVLMDIRCLSWTAWNAHGSSKEFPEVLVIVLTTFDDEEYIIQD